MDHLTNACILYSAQYTDIIKKLIWHWQIKKNMPTTYSEQFHEHTPTKLFYLYSFFPSTFRKCSHFPFHLTIHKCISVWISWREREIDKTTTHCIDWLMVEMRYEFNFDCINFGQMASFVRIVCPVCCCALIFFSVCILSTITYALPFIFNRQWVYRTRMDALSLFIIINEKRQPDATHWRNNFLSSHLALSDFAPKPFKCIMEW